MSRGLPQTAPVVIMGGGIIGVSTLYHLAHRGVAAVLLERRKIASGTTWHAAGIVGQLRDSTAQTELGKYTARLFCDLEEETGQAIGYKQNGTINIALGDVRHEQLLRSHDHAERMGIESRMMTPGEVSAKWPGILTDDVRSGFFVPSNGQVNPLDVTNAMARAARQKGGRIFENTRVTRLETRNGRVTGVKTDDGTIATSKVLLAGGMWSHLFGKAHGLTVPLHAAEHFYVVTEPVPGLARDQPVLNILEERNYWKEDAGKILIGGFEALGRAWGKDGIPDEFEFDELPFDTDRLETELARMSARMPALETLGIKTFFCGPESFTPDGRPFLGPSPELEGVFLATGMNSNGILNSGGVGLTMAEWMCDGAPSRSMGSLLATRAHPFQANTRYNRERAAESVGFHYGLHWAGRQVRSARGVRRAPLHGALEAKGAVMAERIGWEVPMYFDPEHPEWADTPSLRWKPWSANVQAESLAARDSAVLLDQSIYAKIVVQGADAVHLLNSVCGAQMDVEPGTSVYTQILNNRGGIEADITVTRRAKDGFLVVTGHTSQIRDLTILRANKRPEWHCEIFDATSAYSMMSLHGPNSRAILQSLSEDDVSRTAFPFGAAREIDIAHARALVIRRSFLGELGFEILLETEFTHAVHEEICQTGIPLGLRHMGMFAMNACRIEKGFRHFGHDIDVDDTPFDVGLGFAVDLDKDTPFCGQDRLQARYAQESPDWRNCLVSLRVPELTAQDGPWLIHNEPVLREGAIVGHVTSGDFGFRLNAMVGLASLSRPKDGSRDWINEGGFHVRIAGENYLAEVKQGSFYDPSGAIMRG